MFNKNNPVQILTENLQVNHLYNYMNIYLRIGLEQETDKYSNLKDEDQVLKSQVSQAKLVLFLVLTR